MSTKFKIKFYQETLLSKQNRRLHRLLHISGYTHLLLILTVIIFGLYHFNVKNFKSFFDIEEAKVEQTLIKKMKTIENHFYMGHSNKSVKAIINRAHIDSILSENYNNETVHDTIYHIVQKGQTLYSIAKSNNISVDKIISDNNITSKGILTGTKLKINKKNPQNGYYGLDISFWQNIINWPEVHQDTLPLKFDFYIIKATQGIKTVDHKFKINWKHARTQKTIVGAYHYYVFKDDPKLQAQNYISNVSLNKGDFLPIVDVEFNCSNCSSLQQPAEKLVENLTQFITILKQHYGVSPIIYSNTFFYETYLKNHFKDYPIWLAQYSKKIPKQLQLNNEKDVISFPFIAMWQFTSTEKVKGINGNVDANFIPLNNLEHLLIK